jgi:photosystem II stability/assembly factor-like uncharacterized protein
MLRLPGGPSLRGISVVDDRVVWVSGAGGTVVRSLDGGGTFAAVGPTDCTLDFRDVQAFGARQAVVCSAGLPAVVLRTEDGGVSWREVHREADPAAFFDGMAFLPDGQGLLFGDPLGDGGYVLATADRGGSWLRIPPERLPELVEGEAGFAASGTNVAVAGPKAWVVTGGSQSRIWLADAPFRDWQSRVLPLRSGQPSQGAFSIAMAEDGCGVVVGGDYKEPGSDFLAAAWTADGGQTWTTAEGIGGYRSAACHVGDGRFVAVGSHGWSLSDDGGRSWSARSEVGFHAVAASPSGVVLAVGSEGRIARWEP